MTPCVCSVWLQPSSASPQSPKAFAISEITPGMLPVAASASSFPASRRRPPVAGVVPPVPAPGAVPPAAVVGSPLPVGAVPPLPAGTAPPVATPPGAADGECPQPQEHPQDG